jgi:hypothetical protein
MAAFDPVTAALEIGGKLLDRFFPDPAKAGEAKMELAKMAQSGELAKMTNETEQMKAYLADAQSARSRDIEFLKAGRKNIRADVLAYAAIGALILCIFLLFVADVPKGSRDLLLVTLGALVAIVKDVYGFEYGSSKGSERNAQAVSDMLKNGNGGGN